MLEPLRHVLSATRIVLASSSPRRREILQNANLSFEVVEAKCDENLDKSIYRDRPWGYAEDTAQLKANDVLEEILKSREDEADSPLSSLVVIGADTVVTFGDVIYGKPRDEEEAFEMLSRLSGRSHKVYTGVCLLKIAKEGQTATRTFHQETTVHFDTLSVETIRGYIATKEPFDKAGGYGIQAIGGTLITGINGDYFNVMGFPLNKFCREFVEFV